MKTNKGCKYRIYPGIVQKQQIENTLGCCRFVYNRFLAVRSDAWSDRHESLSHDATARMLTALKRDPGHVWLVGADSMALQESFRGPDSAFRNFFARRARYPEFKSKHDHHQSYRTRSHSNSIRIVVGIREFCTDSNGRSAADPGTLSKYERKLRCDQRR